MKSRSERIRDRIGKRAAALGIASGLVLCASLLAGCKPAREPPANAAAQVTVEEPNSDGVKGAKPAAVTPKSQDELDEVDALTMSNGVARRKGRVLTLLLSQRRIRRLVDQPNCASPRPCIRHFFVGALGEDPTYLIVARQFAKASDYLLIDNRSGNELAVINIPQPSPDGRWWVVTSPPYLADAGPEIQLWRAAPRPVLVGLHRLDANSRLLVRGWAATRALDLRILRKTDAQDAGSQARVEVENNIWVFVEEDPLTKQRKTQPLKPFSPPAG